MIVAVTGGTGYIGRHVAARCLAKGWRVHLLARPGSVMPNMLEDRVTRHDTDGSFAAFERALARIAPECVIHLAAAPPGPHDPGLVDRLIEANIGLPTRLLEAMRTTGVRKFVNTGTFWQHYRQADYWPVDLYAATKQAFEDLLRHYTDLLGIAAVTLKLYDNYGPADPRRRIVTALVDAALSGRTLDLSGGEQILDLTHADDVGAAFVRAAEIAADHPDGTNRSFLVSGERIALKSLVAAIAARSARGLNAKLGARPYRVREIMDPIEPPEPLPGWTRTHSLIPTIDAMLEQGEA